MTSGTGLTDRVRRAAARFTTPLLPDDYLRLLNPLWTARELRGKVVKVVRETGDAATLVIKPGWGFPFDFVPGQYVGIGVQVDGRWQWRSYSLTSPPKRDQGHIAVTVKAMPEGFISAHLVNGLAPGTVVRLARPAGEFVLPDPPPERMLFLTAGSGLTPVMSMLRLLDRRGTLPDTVHIHSARKVDDVLFREELQRLSSTHDGYRLHEQITSRDGRFAPGDLDRVCPDWRERQAWACGPDGLVSAVEDLWSEAGLEDNLHVERFSAAFEASGGEGGHVTFRQSQQEVDIDGATTLLEAGEELGIQLPFGCRMGICHTCVIPMVSGAVRDLRNGKETRGEEIRIQTCVTAPVGDCVLDV